MSILRTITLYFGVVFYATGYSQPCSPNSDCKILFTSVEIENDAVIVAMEIPDTYSVPDIPIISRLNKNGVVEWEVQGDLEGLTHLSKIRLYDLTEDYIYALLTIPEHHHNSEPSSQIWKVNKLSGVIEWESKLFESDRESYWGNIGLFEYNDSLICFYNPLRDSNGGSMAGFELYTIDKMSNNMAMVYESNLLLTSLHMLRDHQGNIITAKKPYAIVEKFNGLNLNQRIWKHDFWLTTSATIDYVRELMTDNSGNLYLFSDLDGFIADSLTLTKFDGMTGDLLWNLKLSSRSSFYGVYKIFQNELYISDAWSNGIMKKVDIQNGTFLWNNNNLQYNTPGITSSCHSIANGILSIDFDCNGYVYATGYDKSWPGAWGIMKIDNNNGNMIQSNVITLDMANADAFSIGERIHVLDDSLLAIGYIQTDSLNRVLTSVVSDNMISSIEHPWFSIDQQVSCNPITWIDGNTYSSSNNTAFFGLTGASGCDSIVTLNLTIQQINATLSINDSTLTANSTSGTYQWLDCDNSFSPLNGETSQSFTATNGNYAVVVTENGCADTSNCELRQTVGFGYQTDSYSIKIYPNPSEGILNLSSSIAFENTEVLIMDIQGNEVLSFQINGENSVLNISALASGVYFVRIKSSEQLHNIKIVVQ